MPYKSLKQARYMHEHPSILGPELSEWDKSTDFSKLPERKHPPQKPAKKKEK